jgi:transcriptional regulator with XRE-family HTH domain
METTSANRLKTRRLELKLSVRSAAKRAGMAASIWREYEADARPDPPPLVLTRIAQALSCSVFALVKS